MTRAQGNEFRCKVRSSSARESFRSSYRTLFSRVAVIQRTYGVRLLWLWIRFLQKTRMYQPFIRTAAGFRIYVPNPPGVAGFFSKGRLEEEFLGDPSLSAILHLTKSATTFWDIGANAGLYSLLALANNPRLRVLSVEPSSEHFHALCMNRRENPYQRWVLLHLAIGDRRTSAKITTGLGGFNHILDGTTVPAIGQNEETCLMSTLDDVAEWYETPSIDVLKIDVEGFELAVLRGANRLLTSGRIKALVIEADGHERRYGELPDSLQDLMGNHGYHLNRLSVLGRAGGNCAVYVHKSAPVSLLSESRS